MAEKIIIGGELEPRSMSGVVADASTIIDRNSNKRQSDINTELYQAVEGIEGSKTKFEISLQNGYVTEASGEYSDEELRELLGNPEDFDPAKHNFTVELSKGLNPAFSTSLPVSIHQRRFGSVTTYTIYAKNGDEVVFISFSIANNQYSGSWNYSRSGYISTNESQDLEEEQKETARVNIAALSYERQTLSSEQLVQVQENIGLQRGVAEGVAELDENAMIKVEQIPTATAEEIRKLWETTQDDDAQQ